MKMVGATTINVLLKIKIMKNHLFPRVFHIIGWVLFIPAIILGCLTYSVLSIPMDSVLETVVNDLIITGIAVGAVFIVCSKEQREDEMTRSIRLSALLNSLYIYVGLLVLSTLLINGVAFFWVMMLNLVLFPIIYVVIFRLDMHRYYKMSEDEE